MSAKLRLVFSITMVFASFYGAAQTTYWKDTDLTRTEERASLERFVIEKASAYTLDEVRFKNQLTSVSKARSRAGVVYFPDANGKHIPFEVVEASTFSEALAQKYPNIKSYKGTSVLNDGKRIRFSVSHKGIHSMMSTAGNGGSVFMEKGLKGKYILYDAKDRATKEAFVCKTSPEIANMGNALSARLVNDQVLRKFRLAVAASGEYTAFHGGTKVDALAAINASVTRINEVLENDLGVTLELIGTTDEVIYLDSETDPFTGGLSAQTQNTLDSVIGDANYDIGHLFNQRDNALDGNAGFVGAVCRAGRKGSAYSTLSSPQGDFFAIDLVAHEMGHQFGANHTFSHISEGTQAQVEPGSGTTIMGYAGITNENDVAKNSDDYFHYFSIVQIRDYLATISCGETTSLVNTPPTLVPVADFTIPKGTAFVLSGNATDTDVDDVLTYAWEQTDSGIITQATFGPTSPSGALFRSLPPITLPFRYFPKLERILSGDLTQTTPGLNTAWETLSLVERELNFALTVRDNALNGGQLISDEMSVLVTNDAGPFVVNSQDTSVTYVAGEVQTLSWDVADTHLAPISAETVAIFLSTDGGQTFPILVAENITNNGMYNTVIPGIPTSNGRFMVKASENIFFAVNAANFNIMPSEVVLSFAELDYEICKPGDLVVDFTYETYLDFVEESTFSVTDAPAGLTAVFSTTTAISDDTPVSITFSGTGSLAVGTYPIQVVSTSATVTKEITLNLIIYDTNFVEVASTAPLNGANDVSTVEVLEWEGNVRNTEYDLEIATDIDFTSIIEAVSVANTFYTPTNLENNASYFWRVKPKNSCGEGVFGLPFSFSTISFNCDTVTAFDLPLEISSIDTPTITSKIVFYEDLPIADINVSLNVEHSFLADLQISLISPAGTTVVLVSSSCNDSRDINTVFDDAAPEFVCGGNPAISGTVAPLGSLSSFNGESILGEWTLEIKDNAPADGGRLNSFSMEVCVEGEFRLDADKDGVFDDGDDLCLDTPEGQEVDISGCPIYRFTNQNFNISLESETCRSNNDGKIIITPKVGLSYEVTVSGVGVDETQGFTNTFQISDLSSGTYSVCINAMDGAITYEEFCTQVIISEPDFLGVSSKVSTDGTLLTLNLSGSDFYNLELNGIAIQTQSSNIALDLKNGINVLKVFTDIPCQGVYNEQFVLSKEPILYPNPFTDIVGVYFGGTGSTVTMRIFASDGQFVQGMSLQVNDNGTQIDLGALANGIYYVQFAGEGIKGTAKIIKK
ncbi:zinc-dependent metalloprotease [Maribacter antarcticus]|uniref:zinc-dependent metalloprotease n=1 Tax=Maribacter antarcticus TaxID=505250 RepID=UPI00047BDFF8|nr:zinc-dependent metalloprotease family protein [Maribacter antarcticus]